MDNLYKKNKPKISVGRLVVSYSKGSGRIISADSVFYTIKWSADKLQESCHKINDSVSYDFYNDTEDNFYYFDEGFKDGHLDKIIGRQILDIALTSNLQGYSEGYRKGYFSKLQ